MANLASMFFFFGNSNSDQAPASASAPAATTNATPPAPLSVDTEMTDADDSDIEQDLEPEAETPATETPTTETPAATEPPTTETPVTSALYGKWIIAIARSDHATLAAMAAETPALLQHPVTLSASTMEKYDTFRFLLFDLKACPNAGATRKPAADEKKADEKKEAPTMPDSLNRIMVNARNHLEAHGSSNCSMCCVSYRLLQDKLLQATGPVWADVNQSVPVQEVDLMPLLQAIRNNQWRCAEDLLKAGAFIYFHNATAPSSTFLTKLVKSDDISAIRRVEQLAPGALRAWRPVPGSGASPANLLEMAAAMKNSAMCAFLFSACKPAGSPYDNATTISLMNAIIDQEQDWVMCLLLASESDIFKRLGEQETAKLLFRAVDKECDTIVDLFLASGANPNVSDEHGDTIAHRAAKAENMNLIDVLSGFPEVDFEYINNQGKKAENVVVTAKSGDIVRRCAVNGRVGISAAV